MSIVTFRNVHGVETQGTHDGTRQVQTGELLVLVNHAPILVPANRVVKVEEDNA